MSQGRERRSYERLYSGYGAAFGSARPSSSEPFGSSGRFVTQCCRIGLWMVADVWMSNLEPAAGFLDRAISRLGAAYAIGSTLLVATLFGSAVWYLSSPRPLFMQNEPAFAVKGRTTRGREVFLAGDCASCHATPGQPDRLHLGGGLALSS